MNFFSNLFSFQFLVIIFQDNISSLSSKNTIDLNFFVKCAKLKAIFVSFFPKICINGKENTLKNVRPPGYAKEIMFLGKC